MLGWTAVHVHANKVAAQLQMISHRVLVLLVEEWLTSSVWIIVVPLKLDIGAEEKSCYPTKFCVVRVATVGRDQMNENENEGSIMIMSVLSTQSGESKTKLN